MLDVEQLWIAEVPARLRQPLAACARGDVPANVAAMQLLIESREPTEAETVLARLLDRMHGETHTSEARRLRAALEVLCANPQAWGTVKNVLADVDHDATGTPEEQIGRLARAFDCAARASPEGSVALYALGNADLLSAATAEVVARMAEWGLLGGDRSVLDLGCGIGRFGEALAPRVRSVVGIDISGEMIDAARRRCASFPNATFLQSFGRDLDMFGDGSFDVVLAADTFPYVVQAGMSLVETHFAEVARVLRPKGDFLILNFSYRGGPEQDRAHIERLSRAFGFTVARSGVPAFALWDGVAFHLKISGG
jgi:SAM-dependent methyltransferase